jgi:hypothetical protein
MKGKVFDYGRQGDPLVRPEGGGKVVILTRYDRKLKVGETVDYDVTCETDSFYRGTLISKKDLGEKPGKKAPPVLSKPKPSHPWEKISSMEQMLLEIQKLWGEKFVQHMTPESQTIFPKEMKTIKEKYDKGYIDGAAKMAHDYYESFLWGSETCEVSPIGFNYFPMFRMFESLEKLIRASQAAPQGD